VVRCRRWPVHLDKLLCLARFNRPSCFPPCSQKLKWYALCPVVDSLNHSSFVEVRLLSQPRNNRPQQPEPGHAFCPAW
jgi:hypothetical protein